MKKYNLDLTKNEMKAFLFILLMFFLFAQKAMSQCPTPAGDQLTSGSDSWIGYVYADTDANNPPSNVFTTSYKGFVTENEQFDNDFGTNSLTGSNLCGSYINNYAIRYKMQKTFSAGYYIFTIGGNDGYRLSLDGGLTYVVSNWMNHSYQTSTVSFYLDGATDLVLEYYNQNSNGRLSFSYQLCGNPSTAPVEILSDSEVCNGNTLLLTANGGNHGTNAIYQWGTGNIIGANILTGFDTATLNVTPNVTTTYWVRRIDPAPCNIITSGVTKTITVTSGSMAPTAILGNTSVCYGDTTNLFVVGFLGNVQWQSSLDNINFSDIVGETGPSYTFENIIQNVFIRVLVKNGSCSGVFSDSVEITVSTASISGVVSGAQTVCSSSNSSLLNLTGYHGAIQWQSSADNINFTNLVGETYSSLTILNLSNTTYYRAKVQSGVCEAVFSNSVSIVVNQAPIAGTASSSNLSVCAGLNSSVLSLAGFSGSIQWQSSNDNVTFQPILSATSSIFTIVNLSSSTYYRAAISNTSCSTVYSNTVLVSVNPQLVAGTISGASSVCAGTNSTVLSVTGQVGLIQWQSSADNVNFSNISGATSTSYTATNLSNTTYYRVKVSNVSCSDVYSSSVGIVVASSSVGGTISGSATICSSINSTTLSLTGNNGSIQWQWSSDNITFNNISGATASTYTATNISATTYYRTSITNGSCLTAYSNVITLTFSAPIAGTISGSGTVCLGTNPSLTLSGYSGTIQWQSSNDNVTFNNISGATAATYLASGLTSSTYFKAVVTNGTCGTSTSQVALVTVVNTTLGGSVGINNVVGTSSTVPAGYNSTVLTVSGYNGSTLQWQSSTDNITFSNITGATTTSYTVTNVLVTTYYRVAVTGGSCTAYSTVYSVLICTPGGTPTVYGTGTTWKIYFYAQHDGANPPTNAFTTNYQGYTTCSEVFDNYMYSGNLGANVCGAVWNSFKGAFRYRLTRNFPAGTYTFQVGSNGGYRMSIDGGVTWLIDHWSSTGVSNFTNSAPVALSGNTNLVIEYFNLATTSPRHFFNYCSSTATVTAPTSIYGNISMCLGTNTFLQALGGTGSIYQWGTGNVVGSNVIANATTSAISISPTATTTYWVRRYNSACDTYTSALFTTVTVNSLVAPTPPGGTTDYGNGVWIGYVYASKIGQAASAATAFGGTGSSYTYAGYVTTASDIFSWSGSTTTAPPAAITSATTLCGYYTTNFSIRYKMTKNFTPGYYTFTISADDGMRFSVDGGTTWAVTRWGYVAGTGATTNTYSVFLSGSTNLIIEYNSGTGGLSLSFNYSVCTDFSTAPTSISGTTSICTGNSTTLTATGGYNSPTSTYEWGTGSVIGSNLLPYTTASITVTPSANTTYWVRRKNGGSCNETVAGVTSGAYTTGVTTTVTLSPLTVVGTISGGGNTVCANSNSTVLTLSGNTGSIQWQSSTNNSTWTNISGATSPTYTATNLSSTTYYRAVVTSGSCTSATTSSVSINVIPVSVAGTISGATSVCSGINSSVLTLSGYTGTLQWQSSLNNVSFTNLVGETSQTLSVSNLSATTYYRVVVTSGICSSVTSTSVAVVVVPLSNSGTAIGNATVCSGINSSTITLAGYVGTIQWQSSSDNVNFTAITSATSATYTATNLTSTKYYRAIVTNGICSSSISNSVSVIVNTSPVTGTISGATTVCYGTNSTLLTLSGSSGSIQWQSSTDNNTFVNITSATSNTLTISNLTNTTYYRVVLSNGMCSSIYPGSVAINVNPISVAGTISGATSVCSGTNSNVLTLTGYTGSIQWKSSSDNITFTDIVGATNAVYNASNLNATTYYKAIVTSGSCSSSSSTSVMIYVRPASDAGTATGTATVCAGINSTALTLSNYVGNIQWQSSTDNINFSNIYGATSNTYSAINLTTTYFYRAVVTTNLCSSDISNSIEVTVLPYAVAGSIAITGTTLSTINVCSGTNSTKLTLVGSAGTPQWQSSVDNMTYTDIVGANGTTYTASGLTATTYFRAILVSGSCGSLQSTASVLINVPASVTYNGTWSGIPNASTTLVVANNLSLTNNINVCSCQVTGTSQMTIPSGVTMLVQKNIVVNSNASLVVEDNGSIVQVDNTVVNTGNITFKRNTTPLKQYDYTYWSSPLAGQTLGQLVSSSLFYSFNPSISNWVGEGGATVMTPGKGYISRAPNNLSYSTPQVVSTVFNGVPNNGIVSVPIVKNSGTTYNLIGNPYPSAIDIDQFLLDPSNSNVVNGTIYLWTHNTAIASTIPGTQTYNYTKDDYAKYNLTGGVKTASAAITGGSTPTGKIAAGQGFFIEANSALTNGTYTATFNNSMRVIGQNNQFFKNSLVANQATTSIEKHRIWLNITDSQGSYDETLIGYVAGATNGLDSKFDGKTMPAGNVVSLYSVLGSDKLAIQGRSLPFDNVDVIPLGYISANGGNFSIGLENFDGLFQNQEVYLLDKTTNSYHNLKQSDYDFTTAIGTFNDRFEIHFTNSLLSNVENNYDISNVRIIKSGKHIVVDAGLETIENVSIFDILGKKILNKSKLSSSSYTSADIEIASQILIVKVALEDGSVVSKKILMN